jgi:hypothetical protein
LISLGANTQMWLILFFNQSCGDRVKQMLGDGWDDPMHASIFEGHGMVKVPSEMVAAFQTHAPKKDLFRRPS